MDAKHEGGHYFKVKYEWIALNGDQIELSKNDSGFLKDWTLIQIEGEEPKPPESAAPVDPKAAAAKKAPAPAAKPDPKKGGAAGLEEITDNRPRIITFTKDFAAEAGGAGMKINEEIAKRISETSIKIDIIEVNRETLEESVKDSVMIDISCLLYPNVPQIEFQWNFDKLKPLQIHYLNLKITSD